ncbi:MAG: leucine-rich repeat domain-containing protein, partial [Leptospirales bacterium]|nr:leucine-rich repeat domain-containing protein [Leptospirales bacterium]
MKKKALSAAAVFMLAATIFAQSESDFEVRQNADNTLTITKYTGTAKDVVIPSTLHGLRVTIIGSEAFYENNLTSVVIPNTVTDIEKSAFYGNKLTEISLPVSLKEIGQGAFRHNKIRTLVIPDGVTLISSLDRHIPQEYIQGLGWRNKAEAYTHNGAFADNPIEFLSIPASLSKESSVKLSKLYDEIAFAT